MRQIHSHCTLGGLSLNKAVEIDRRERDGRFQLLYLGLEDLHPETTAVPWEAIISSAS
jgi:hypothetical protein